MTGEGRFSGDTRGEHERGISRRTRWHRQCLQHVRVHLQGESRHIRLHAVFGGRHDTYVINGYSVADTTTSTSITVDSSSAWWAGHYVIGESAQSSTTASSSYSDIVSGATNAVSISSTNSPIAVWGTSTTSAGNVYNGPCLVLATTSAESLVLRVDDYGWDDWYDYDNFTLASSNTSDEATLLKDCTWRWTITYNSSSQTVIFFEAYAN